MRITPSTLPTSSRNSEVSLMEVGYPGQSELSKETHSLSPPQTTWYNKTLGFRFILHHRHQSCCCLPCWQNICIMGIFKENILCIRSLKTLYLTRRLDDLINHVGHADMLPPLQLPADRLTVRDLPWARPAYNNQNYRVWNNQEPRIIIAYQ